jgi:NAD(P)-dependent dehydrogenase (short-subunit alcohol dehydrogenase family)
MSDRFLLAGDAAVVTGAARGLGRAIATAFADEGARVVLADISPDVENVARSLSDRGGTAMGLVTDVTRASDCGALAQFAAEKLGHIDMLVCNAGIDIPGSALTIGEDVWDRVVDVNLKGYFLCAQAIGRRMAERGQGGSVVMITSFAATHAVADIIAYNAAKGGVNQLVRTLALEWAGLGIRVNGVAPGYLENIMVGMEGTHRDTQTEERVHRHTPLGRRAKLEEIANAVVFLCTKGASYITGSILAADGGYTSI